MTEEEKEAIESLKGKEISIEMNWTPEQKATFEDVVGIKEFEENCIKVDILIKLIEKLQKENEESKELYDKLFDGYNKLVQEHLELEKENEELKEENIILEGNKIGYKLAIQESKTKLEIEKTDNLYNKEETNEEMIPKDKIRKEIKELEEMNASGMLFETAVSFAKLILKNILEE